MGASYPKRCMTLSEWSDFERKCMARALEVAEKGVGQVSPNPPVGCVLARDGEIIAEGWHDHLGDLHAEQAAIADAEARGVATQGATAFVTLEPCNHHGRTPPCTEALLWAGINRVVIAAEDINPTVRGGGIDCLKQAEIEVTQGLMEAEARQQMAAFMHWCERRRPIVILKAALDCNGNVDSTSAPPARFTSEESLDEVHRLRLQCDAVLVGVNTVIRDDPKLTVRRVDLGKGRQPLRIVLDRRLRTPEKAEMVVDEESTVVLHCEGEGESLECETILMPPLFSSGEEGVDLVQLLDLLGDREVQRLLVEGGPNVWGRFLTDELVDEACIFHSKVDLGEGLNGGITSEILEGAGLMLASSENIGGDRLDHWLRA
ncbi:MAG: bifunctional diaminohydroxyphosphoribosylaminopyrimidine deaminase/5-amino-6-(5-phosphoribosylamino)uracil reductase RibD [Candidatus Thalassarchaeaceae archaeon]|nr:bifunctional diaminohydroxyphosphoribosylaminopyrimidine deaminase/5-amino-6-(5-phosphoribosylamino)uracil reductase RibD [Candidatus Thalassarchaeaceae archaeon]